MTTSGTWKLRKRFTPFAIVVSQDRDVLSFKEEERNNREANIKAYNQLFDEYGLSVTTQWRKVQSQCSIELLQPIFSLNLTVCHQFKEDAKDDVRFTSLDKLDRLALFQHRIRDLERIEAEDKRKARETLRRWPLVSAFSCS